MSLEVNIRGRRAETIVASGALAMTGLLSYGVYDVWSAANMSIGVGTPEATAAADAANGLGGPLDLRTLTATNGYRVAAGNTISVRIPQNGDIIGFIGSGAVYWHKVD